MIKYALLLSLFLAGCSISLFGQDTARAGSGPRPPVTARFAGYDGIMVLGYVDKGAYLNFTGPNVSVTLQRHKIILGMLPSLRFKQDRSAVKNAFVTPNLGVGITYCYRKLAVQVPLYYNAKTTTVNGRWHIGIGAGIRLK